MVLTLVVAFGFIFSGAVLLLANTLVQRKSAQIFTQYLGLSSLGVAGILIISTLFRLLLS